jgi:uncharacterized protein YjbI with pentapeptide repeats
MTAQDLLAAYAAGVRDFSGRRLSQQANLRQANLSEAFLFGADLSEANLNGAFLSEANLRGVRPEGVLDGVIEP